MLTLNEHIPSVNIFTRAIQDIDIQDQDLAAWLRALHHIFLGFQGWVEVDQIVRAHGVVFSTVPFVAIGFAAIDAIRHTSFTFDCREGHNVLEMQT